MTNMQKGDAIRIRVAVNGGAVWLPGKILASFPRAWNRRSYDVMLDSGTRIINADPISIRKVAA